MGSTFAWTGGSSGVWDLAGNWSAGSSYPGAVASDTATFDYRGVGTAVAGQDVTAVGSINTLSALLIKSTYTKAFGDADTPVKVGATLARIGDASGSATAGTGSGRIHLDFHTVATTIVVVSTATTSTDTGREPVRIKGVNAANKISVLSGRVGIATNGPTDVATFGEIGCQGSSAVVNVSSGVTLTTFRQTDGTATLYCGMTTLAQDGGTATTYGSGAITTVQVAGTFNSNSSGTITTLEVQPDGIADFTRSITARTVTTIKLYKGSTLTYDPAVLTVSNPIQLINCGLDDVTINVPAGITIAIVAV